MGRFQLFFGNGLTRLGEIQPIIDYVYFITLLMHFKVISVKVILAGLLLLGFISGTQATVIQQFAPDRDASLSLGGYDMTVFDIENDTNFNPTTSVPSPLGGSLSFLDRNGHSAALDRGLANSTWWWNNTGTDYDIFTTSLHVVTIVLPENTQAFYFNVGATIGNGSWHNAWLNAKDTNGVVTANKTFRVDQNKTPGFGVYNESTDCSSSIKSITIDPFEWGFGNFSISQGSCGVSVPESTSLYLLLFGLLGLLVTARKNT